MRIAVFYRSNEASNRYVSATRHKTDQMIDGWSKLDVKIHYENLDKRKFQNYFKKFETPDVVFVWHDEEIIIDFIQKNYPNIKIETMSGEDREYDEGVYRWSSRKNEFKIYDRIKEVVEGSVPEITVWKIRDCKIISETKKANKITGTYYQTKDEAEKFILHKINNELSHHRKRITELENILKEMS